SGWHRPTRSCSGTMARWSSIPSSERAPRSACGCRRRERNQTAPRKGWPEPAEVAVERAGMRALLLIAAILAFLAVSSQPLLNSSERPAAHVGYIGFDRNDYPGDSNLKTLRQTFSYSGYWLNNPPGAKTNSWTGKRKALQVAGFGFLVLFNGRTYAEIKSAGNAVKVGSSDAAAAVSAARAEGFPLQTILFLDQEQGGRLLPAQRAYLHAWIDGVNSAGFVAGVYCSGIAAKEGSGASIVTAEDIRANAGGRKITYWVVN